MFPPEMEKRMKQGSLVTRVVVFTLALMSFACLLGAFYGLWSMHSFACWILPPATLILIAIAYRSRPADNPLESPRTWIVQGAIGGVVAAIAYDLYRLPFVLKGAPLFKVFPKFGELILNGTEPTWLVQTLGWAYHFSNGAALGIMFLAMIGTRITRNRILLGAIAWALFIEGCLLITPYTNFFGLKLDGRFLFLTASAHLIFGVSLGVWFRRRLA
jgi:hypothetical protein